MRTLRRPMFRMGGSANEGITSGLDKPKRGLVNEPGSYAGSLEDIMQSADKIVQSRRPKETYKERDDLLINLGLDLVTRPPSGNIVSTVGAAAKAPFKQFQTAQATKRKTQAESESDLFNTLVGAGTKLAGGGADGKGWLEQWKFNQIPLLINDISSLQKKVDDGTATEQEKLDLRSKETQFNRLNTIDPITDAFLKSDDGSFLIQDVKAKILQKDRKSDEPKYKDENDPQLVIDALAEVRRILNSKAEGGRIGYQDAGPVMPAAGNMGQATGNMGQAAGNMQQETMPEELKQDLTFEELRNRLPQEIGDDIINLILTSAEAMEDFATIQTEQDISIFNKKYGVNLVLPSEG